MFRVQKNAQVLARRREDGRGGGGNGGSRGGGIENGYLK